MPRTLGVDAPLSPPHGLAVMTSLLEPRAWRYDDAKLLPMPGRASPFWDKLGQSQVINGRKQPY